MKIFTLKQELRKKLVKVLNSKTGTMNRTESKKIGIAWVQVPRKMSVTNKALFGEGKTFNSKKLKQFFPQAPLHPVPPASPLLC